MSDTDCGHGHVIRAPLGYKARCGGPPLCRECQRDLERIAAQATPADVARMVVEQELEATFRRAVE